MSSMEMPMGGRRAAARNAAERRKKIVLAGLVAVFLALLVYEVPHLLNRSSSSSSSSATATTAAPTGAASSSQALPSAATSASRARARALAHLKPKDPFVPLIRESSSSSSSSSTSLSTSQAPTLAVSHPKPAKAQAVSAAKPAAAKAAPAKPARAVKPKPAAPTGAVIWANGRPQAVRVSQMFAIGDVTFRLVGVGTKTIRVQVGYGSFAGGKHMIKVRKGHPVTFTNTATGVQYHLLFTRPTK
jgi:hypothetical protein